jgi:hypothetical protein
MHPHLPSLYSAPVTDGGAGVRFPSLPRSRPIGEGVCTGALRGWERNKERLPPGYGLDTINAAIWVLRRPDGTAASYFSAWSATREAVERAAREDHRTRSKRRTTLTSPSYSPR